MKLIKTDSKLRCELGVCKNRAEYALVLDRTGIRSRIYLCSQCIEKLYEVAKTALKQKKAEAKNKNASVKTENAEEEVND